MSLRPCFLAVLAGYQAGRQTQGNAPEVVLERLLALPAGRAYEHLPDV